MKRKLIPFILMISALILLFLFILKNVAFCPISYKNCASLSNEENKAIKTLVLNAVKDRNSCLFTIDQASIYSSEKDNNIQLEYPSEKKAILNIVDGSFMQNTVKKDDDTYELIVKSSYPERCYYHFTIERSGNDFIITHYLIDT